MRRWGTIIATVAIAYGIVIVAGAAIIYGGVYDVSATTPHWDATRAVMDVARMRSIAAHADGIRVPPHLDAPETLAMGVEHFAAHCAVCHGAPGVPRGDIAEGMYPKPPDLAKTAARYSDAELFWILKHGIKMTGMPAWADHTDDELWATVAFLRRFPTLSEVDYAKLVMANVMHGTMHHHGGSDPSTPDAPHERH